MRSIFVRSAWYIIGGLILRQWRSSTTPAATPGIVIPSNATYSTIAVPAVQVNLVNATIYGAALAPEFAGLYQLAFQVPPSLTNGTYQVFATIGSPANNIPMLEVQQ